MPRTLAAALLSLALLPSALGAQTAASRFFDAVESASPHAPSAIGSYARGCAAGLERLPETGPSWQAMRLSRGRNWGHPEAIDFVRRLGREAQDIGWAGIYVGDMSQPRGGPMPSSHRSHQTGLDLDIWMRPADRLDLSRTARERLSSISIRSADRRRLSDNWTEAHGELLEAAARDPAVARIFVTAPAKIRLCRQGTRADADWLEKIRPLYGHHYHFHVRLACPEGSPACVTQTPTVSALSEGPGGCDETLMWWVTDRLDPPDPDPAPAEPSAPRRHPRDYTLSELPRQCRTVLGAQ